MRTAQALMEQLGGLAHNRPVLDVYEDVHWADPSTLELLDLLVERVRTPPLVAVLTYRPDLTPTWSGCAHLDSFTLSRLGQRHGAQMIERLTGKPLPGKVLQRILAKTDGISPFVEQLTKTVLESCLLADASDRYGLAGPLPPPAIPAPLHDSLRARLDRLGPIRGDGSFVCPVVSAEDRARLEAIVADRNRAQKHVARAQIILAAADRLRVAEVARRAGVGRPAVWRWQRAFPKPRPTGCCATPPASRAKLPWATSSSAGWWR